MIMLCGGRPMAGGRFGLVDYGLRITDCWITDCGFVGLGSPLASLGARPVFGLRFYFYPTTPDIKCHLRGNKIIHPDHLH